MKVAHGGAAAPSLPRLRALAGEGGAEGAGWGKRHCREGPHLAGRASRHSGEGCPGHLERGDVSGQCGRRRAARGMTPPPICFPKMTHARLKFARFSSMLVDLCSSVPGRAMWPLVSTFVVKRTYACSLLRSPRKVLLPVSCRWPRNSLTRPGSSTSRPASCRRAGPAANGKSRLRARGAVPLPVRLRARSAPRCCSSRPAGCSRAGGAAGSPRPSSRRPR